MYTRTHAPSPAPTLTSDHALHGVNVVSHKSRKLSLRNHFPGERLCGYQYEYVAASSLPLRPRRLRLFVDAQDVNPSANRQHVGKV